MKILPFEGATTFVDAFTFALLIIVLVFKTHRPVRGKGNRQGLREGASTMIQERKSRKGAVAGLIFGRGCPALSGAAGESEHLPGNQRSAQHLPAHQPAVLRAEKGGGLLPGGGVHEPAQRLHRPVFPGPGGLHAPGGLHLRHPHRPHVRQGHGVLPVRGFGGALLPARPVRRAGCPPPASSWAWCWPSCWGAACRLLRIPHRPAGAAPEERLSGHRHPGALRRSSVPCFSGRPWARSPTAPT